MNKYEFKITMELNDDSGTVAQRNAIAATIEKAVKVLDEANGLFPEDDFNYATKIEIDKL